MSDATNADRTGMPLDVLDRIDRICDRFERAWEAGERPRIEDYLDEIAAAYRSALFLDLLAADFIARCRRGERPALAEYAARYPERAAGILDLLTAPDRIEWLETGPDDPGGRDAGDGSIGPGGPPRRLGHYRIDRPLGRGGMGVVYRAFDEKRGAAVALKTVKRSDPAAILRFKQEFRALADVSHPNLVTLHELVADGPTWFFTMELVEGVDFLTFVRSGTDRPAPVPETTEDPQPPGFASPGAGATAPAIIADAPPRAPRRSGPGSLARPRGGVGLSPAALSRLRIALSQLARGIAALHEAGKLHRDLKPSNVLVTRQGRVVILDFGLAAELEPSGLHQSSLPYILGTVSYMAPEQAAGLPVYPASDWYSFGSMLYHALTGHPPFLGRPLEVLRDKLRFEPPAPRELVPDLPDDLDALCIHLLRRDPQARPTGREVLRRVGSTRGEPEPPVLLQPSPPGAVPLVGRARDLACLEAAFADMCRGRTVACSIHGPSGVGKTALVRHFLDDRVGPHRTIVLAGRCYEQESVPYKALDSAIDALGRYLKGLPIPEARSLLPRDIQSLVRIFPTLRQAEVVATAPRPAAEVPDPHELRRRAFNALRELLAHLGDRLPLILAIDDLQWGDADSAVLLADLLRPPDPPKLLLLGCYRSEDAATSPLLRAMRTGQGGGSPTVDHRVLPLATLEPADAESLARVLLGRQDQAGCAHAAVIVRESGGNPFFVAELVRYVQADAGLLDRVPEAEELAFDEVLWARTRRLPEPARRLLEVIAVSGRPLGQAEAALAAELDAAHRTAWNVLRSGRLIRSTGPAERDEIETYHDRVREAVVGHIPKGILEGHHRRLALVLEHSGRADPEVLAVHFHGAGERDRAGTYFAQAAAQATDSLAFDRAAKLYRLALELRTWDDAEARRLRIGLADALANAGRGPEAARAYLAAVEGASSAETLELRRLAALQFLITGHHDEGHAQLGAVLNAAGMTLPSTPGRALLPLILNRIKIRLRGLRYRPRAPHQIPEADLTRIDVCWAAVTGLGITDPVRGACFQARHLLLALRAGEPNRLARALTCEAGHVATAGGRSRRRTAQLLSRAQAIAQQLDDPHTWAMLIGTQGMAAYLSGDWRRGGELCDRSGALFRSRCTGATWEVDTVTLVSLWSLQFRGELVELGRRWPVHLKEARERGDRYLETNLDTLLMSTLRLAADDPEGAEAELCRVMARESQQSFRVQQNEWCGAMIQTKLYRGEGAAAWDFLATRYAPLLVRSHLMHLQKIKIFFHERRARCALAAASEAADPGPLLRSARRDAKRLHREGMAWSRALAYPIEAGIAAARGDGSRAATLFAAAVNHLEAVDMRLHAAASRRRLGELLGGDEGRALIEQADSWMRQQTIQNPARMAAIFAPVVA